MGWDGDGRYFPRSKKNLGKELFLCFSVSVLLHQFGGVGMGMGLRR